ncbi:MAG: CDP-alcohol phosphatidyltransferase family protein [Kiritimatiellales bacterium]|nr:CDP-alcohol phosphatidyltransferase family protein [Kiritimatiellales bacterium]
MHFIPWILIALRALLPILIWRIAHIDAPGILAAICIFIAALSDVYDGKIARKIGTSTPALRRTDSVVDLFFLVSTIILFVMYHAPISRPAASAITLMFLMSITGHAIALIRFKHNAAVHSKKLKIYAVFVYIGFFFAWITGSLSPWIFIALAVGIIAEAERHWILLRSKTEPIDISTLEDARNHKKPS